MGLGQALTLGGHFQAGKAAGDAEALNYANSQVAWQQQLDGMRNLEEARTAQQALANSTQAYTPGSPGAVGQTPRMAGGPPQSVTSPGMPGGNPGQTMRYPPTAPPPALARVPTASPPAQGGLSSMRPLLANEFGDPRNPQAGTPAVNVRRRTGYDAPSGGEIRRPGYEAQRLEYRGAPAQGQTFDQAYPLLKPGEPGYDDVTRMRLPQVFGAAPAAPAADPGQSQRYPPPQQRAALPPSAMPPQQRAALPPSAMPQQRAALSPSAMPSQQQAAPGAQVTSGPQAAPGGMTGQQNYSAEGAQQSESMRYLDYQTSQLQRQIEALRPYAGNPQVGPQFHGAVQQLNQLNSQRGAMMFSSGLAFFQATNDPTRVMQALSMQGLPVQMAQGTSNGVSMFQLMNNGQPMHNPLPVARMTAFLQQTFDPAIAAQARAFQQDIAKAGVAPTITANASMHNNAGTTQAHLQGIAMQTAAAVSKQLAAEGRAHNVGTLTSGLNQVPVVFMGGQLYYVEQGKAAANGSMGTATQLVPIRGTPPGTIRWNGAPGAPGASPDATSTPQGLLGDANELISPLYRPGG